MKSKYNYVKGKSIFIISLLVIGITIFTVYVTGINYDRSITSNFYISLGCIATVLFFFMTYGLYNGTKIINNFPKFRNFKRGSLIDTTSVAIETPISEVGEGIGGLIISLLLWVVMTIVMVILLIILEAIFWFTLFILLTMLYWVFFRALKLVFNKSNQTKGDLGISLIYSVIYTLFYTGWIFGIVYLAQIVR
ncbi:conserved membrane hypothetical protein [Flavobacterium sp. 9AF]|uniref:hypothetical protein n=1 Tax=Flavobacterium sp. 9AF TaxID=2653142 RepID=UPI0012F0C184|nr:hypothetical protein [Flavobacterium sp. 9AF]VXB67408.1 conserved membrane hypothetical protein [Flavobacterium sp. 9AF]